MHKSRLILIFISIAIVVLGFCISLLTNYASEKVPTFLQENPNLIWILIAIGLFLLCFLTISHYLIEESTSKSRSKTSSSKKNSLQSKKEMLTVPNSYDAFISYSHKDSNWVQEELLENLENRGFKICIDFRDFPGGGASMISMEKAVIASKRVILVLTPNYISSEWSTFENLIARTTDPAAIRRKVIPILREDCDLPLYISMLTWRDLRPEHENEDEWDRLAQDLM